MTADEDNFSSKWVRVRVVTCTSSGSSLASIIVRARRSKPSASRGLPLPLTHRASQPSVTATCWVEVDRHGFEWKQVVT